jgi:hypothetical protein
MAFRLLDQEAYTSPTDDLAKVRLMTDFGMGSISLHSVS